MNGYDVVMPVGMLVSGGNPYGVVIDGVPYQLAGEPAPRPPSVHFAGYGQT